MTREEIIKGLGKIGDFFRARADMAVGDGKMMLLNWMKCAEEAAEVMKAQEVTPEELERLKKCRHECKIECLLKEYDRVKDERDALLKAQEPRLLTYEDFHSGREDGGEAIPCWKEARSKTRRSGWAVIVYGKMLADRETGVARYWTAKPTEEQMQEVAWPGA